MGLLNNTYRISRKATKTKNVDDISKIEAIDRIPKNKIDILKNSFKTWENKKLHMKVFSPEVKEIIEKKWIEAKGHLMTTTWIKHTIYRHWEKAKLQKDEVPVTWEDLEITPYIVKYADKVRLSDKLSDSWNLVLKYEKTIWNKYYYLEYFNEKNGFFENQTMYINKVKNKVKNKIYEMKKNRLKKEGKYYQGED